MTAIIVLTLSFVGALLGFAHSHAAKSDQAYFLGLTRLGLVLAALAIVGFIFGIAKEIQSVNSETERTRMLKELHAKVVGETTQASPAVAQKLQEIGDRIRMIALSSRESDFAMSDFVRSNFEKGRFTEANFTLSDFSGASFRDAMFRDASFRGAHFPGADLRGADLGNAVVDERTVLPKK